MGDELQLVPSPWISISSNPDYNGIYQVRNGSLESTGSFKNGTWGSSVQGITEWRGCIPNLSNENIDLLQRRIAKFSDSTSYAEEAKESVLLLARHYVEQTFYSKSEESRIARNRAIVHYRIAVTLGWPLEDRDQIFLAHNWQILKPKQRIKAEKLVQDFINSVRHVTVPK